MPIPAGQAIVPRRLRVSSRPVLLCCACVAATLFGVSVMALSFSLILTSHAGSPAYWLVSGILLVIWLITLAKMCRRAAAALRLSWASSARAGIQSAPGLFSFMHPAPARLRNAGIRPPLR